MTMTHPRPRIPAAPPAMRAGMPAPIQWDCAHHRHRRAPWPARAGRAARNAACRALCATLAPAHHLYLYLDGAAR